MARTVTLTAKVRDKAGHLATRTSTLTVPMLLGMDAPQGPEWQAALADYPGLNYTRDFGKDNLYTLSDGTYDTDTRTEWSRWGTGKWIGAPANMLVHLSVKDDALEFLDDWFASIPTNLPRSHVGVYLSPWHEPVDDVRDGAITTAWFRAQGKAIADYVRTHPKGWVVKGNGPVLTRYDLDELGTDPKLYGYEGMTHFFFDSYQSSTTGGYWSNAKMIDTPIGKIRAAYPGVRVGIPEFGFARQSTDTTGQARADAIRRVVTYCRSIEGLDCFAYFNDEGSIPTVPFAKDSPEGIAYRELLAASS